MANIRLIVGLGNPGRDYEQTRHNAGFWLVDQVAHKYAVTPTVQSKFFGMVAKFNHHGDDIYLLKPQTYMNVSGRAVLSLMNFFKIPSTQMLVVHDELDFAPGIVKFKLGGGNGGHNGLKDIDRVIGRDYWRLRIGIGHPGDKNKVADYVLKPPSVEDKIVILTALDRAVNVFDMVLSGEFNSAMRQLHS